MMTIESARWRAGCCLLVLGLLGSGMAWAQDEDEADVFLAGLKAGKLPCAVDELVSIPATWSLTPERLDELYHVPEGVEPDDNVYFEWLTTARDRAYFIRRPFTNLSIDLTLFGGEVPVEDVTVDFLDGKLNGISISVFNRGDAESIAIDEFERRKKLCGQALSAQLGVRPVARKANPTQGLLTEGWVWVSAKGMAVLEHNPEAAQGRPEFLRMKIAPRDTKGAFAAAMRDRSSATKLSDLPRNVVREANGDVYIKGIPMVDQGPKGYCVVASCQRLLEYYGIPCDQHQIAQIAEADAQRGTNTLAMAEALEKVDFRFKTRFTKLFALMTNGKLYEMRRREPSEFRDFEKKVVDYVDDGIPLLWSLELGKYEEEPSIAQQAGGGHMRMVIGYNPENGKLIFSDSWGAGHEVKYMDMRDAYQATHGLYVMHPTVR
ncbi:MAG: C39 family peptidase [Verrucomicrobiota bacterium]